MAAYHDRIKEVKKIMDRVTILVVTNPSNVLFRNIFEHVTKRYKNALNNEPPL